MGLPWELSVKNLLPVQETCVQSLVGKIPLALEQLNLCTTTTESVL